MWWSSRFFGRSFFHFRSFASWSFLSFSHYLFSPSGCFCSSAFLIASSSNVCISFIDICMFNSTLYFLACSKSSFLAKASFRFNSWTASFLCEVLIAFLITTKAPFAPGIDPLITNMLLAGSSLTISRFWMVTCSEPRCPGIVIPFQTLFPEISPIDPVWRKGCDPPPPPCDLGPMCWFHLLMVPAKPLPLEIAVTSTISPAWKSDASMVSPKLYPVILRISFTNRLGVVFACLNLLISGRLICDAFLSSVASCVALYPSFSTVRTLVTTFGLTSTIVTGIKIPSLVNSCVIPTFLPKIPFMLDPFIKNKFLRSFLRF
ncbi:conserved hypothetical membrane protein [Metamycoplasma arthritidis 158L3-1]|uniref:Conserved hypothetical membrane protein n=1 Tax=Metamycoplasma arthritidis (strain 158L3-1) TaxID=243272 RepID=B3PMP7_META1|nr:conserved hypothetical membrane protein [Metamycoplasma arthritidis 158L3-1]